MFGWFDNSQLDAFAREISEEFSRNWPLDKSIPEKTAEQKLLHAIEILGNRAAKFNRQSPMGWYRKARFLRTIKEELRAGGGTTEIVDRVVYAAAVRMARRDSTAA